jgi:hypothetical protein
MKLKIRTDLYDSSFAGGRPNSFVNMHFILIIASALSICGTIAIETRNSEFVNVL